MPPTDLRRLTHLLLTGLIAMWVLMIAPCHALEIVTLDSSHPLKQIGRQLELLEDPTGQKSLDDVREATGWIRSQANEPNMGFTDSVWWARVTLMNTDPSSREWVLNINDAILNHIEVFFILADSTVVHKIGGGWTPIHDRDIPYRTHAFRIPNQSPDELVEIYLRASSKLAVVMPAQVMSANEFTRRNTSDTVWYAFYIGLITSIILFNAFVYVSMREIMYFYYVGFCFFLLLLSICFSGIGKQYLWTEMQGVDNYLLAASGFLFTYFGTHFANHFLFESDDGPVAFMRLRTLILDVLCLSGTVLTISGHFSSLVTLGFIVCVLGTLNVYVNAFLCLRSSNGNRRHAYYLIVAWGGVLIGGLVFTARSIDLIPSNFFTANAMQIGSLFDSVMLMIALIEKSRFLREKLIESERQSRTLLEVVQKRTTELVDTQQKLVASEKMAALGIFTAGMAHEINNPANFIAAGAQNADAQLNQLAAFVDDLLADDADPDIKAAFGAHFKRITGSLDVIRTGVSRVENVVRNLRAANPEGNVGMQPADVAGSLESAWRVLSPTVKTPIRIDTALDARPDVTCVIADIHQVFLALLSNAVHAIEDRAATMGDTPDERIITLGPHIADGSLAICVSDNGAGIPAPLLDKIFDPFFTTKTVGRGAGLGLSMARDVIKKHGGTLDVISQPGKGSTFTLTLPIEGPDNKAMPA